MASGSARRRRGSTGARRRRRSGRAPPARADQLRAGPRTARAAASGDGRAGRDHDLELRGRQLELVARIAAEARQHFLAPVAPARACPDRAPSPRPRSRPCTPERPRSVSRRSAAVGGRVWRHRAHGKGSGAMRLLPVPGVFQPLSDSHMLADHLRRERLGPGVSVLDLCAGSGLLALVAARRGATAAVDVSRRAVLSVRLNAALNGVKVTALRGDLFAPVAGRRFDVIVSNPPYLPAPGRGASARGLARAVDAGPRGRGPRSDLRPGGRVPGARRGAAARPLVGVRGGETIDTLAARGCGRGRLPPPRAARAAGCALAPTGCVPRGCCSRATRRS